VSAHDRGDSGNAYLTGFYCDPDGNKVSEEKAISLIKSIGFVDISGPMGTDKDESIWRTSSNSSTVASSSSSASANTNPANQNKLPIAFSWVGRDAPVLGDMTVKQDQGRGQLSLAFDENGSRVTCKGSWRMVSGSYGTDTLPNGTWALACKNGQTATGTYISHENLHGKCVGTDDEGRSVSCTF